MNKPWSIPDYHAYLAGKKPAPTGKLRAGKSSGDTGKPNIHKPTANQLTQAAIRYLQASGWNVWRQNNGAVFDQKKGVHRAGSAKKGVSDIIGFHKETGRFFAGEVKVGRDKLSPWQQEFLEQVNNAGGLGIVIRSIDDVIELLK